MAVILASVFAVLSYFETSSVPPQVLSVFSGLLSPALGKLLVILLGLFAVFVGLRMLRRLDDRLKRVEGGLSSSGPAIAELDRLLSRGEEILTKAQTIPTDRVTGPLETRHVENDNAKWEQEIGAWLDKAKPRFKDDFLAKFHVPHGADIRETVILRVAVRLERLRSVKASVI